MELEKSQQLTAGLQELVGEIADDLKRQLEVPGLARTRAEAVYRDERVGYDFDVWLDLLARRAGVLWVLKTVYVRVLEDRGFLSPIRIRDRESQDLFEHLTPGLGDTAYLRWVFRDLASEGGLPELFAPQPAEVALPSNELSKKLLTFWRKEEEAAAERTLQYRFDDEHFDGRLMGDLYQDLDPVVKKQYALLQTPDFVVDFILDETLTPAIAEFGVDAVRVIDPACGSGHFLLDAFKRLVAAMREKFPDRPIGDVVRDVLARVVGIDLNDYACGLARARLVMTALETVGERTLASGGAFHPQIFWADGLEQVERDEQVEMAAVTGDSVRATLTRPEIRKALRPILKAGFHVVVANPPYITETDPWRKKYHREKVGNRQRYVSAYREYSLGSAFTERCFQLADMGGLVGIITGNNFMKREFGKPLIESVLARLDLTLVVDTSQAYIPFHGTPTVLIFGRNRRPEGETVRVVMGKRGESGTPEDPAKGKVWSSIAGGWDQIGFENEYVSVADLPRETLNKHPWSLGGGGAAELKIRLDQRAAQPVGALAEEIGVAVVLREDDLFIQGFASTRAGIPEICIEDCIEGISVRDWGFFDSKRLIFPYDRTTLSIVTGHQRAAIERRLWPWRAILEKRVAFGKTQVERGLAWFEYSMLFNARHGSSLLLAFPKVATHNHFALHRRGPVAIASTHIIKLPAGCTEEDHLALLGLLNSSTACFWMKQVFHNKGIRGQGGGLTVTDWEQFYEFDATKAKLFPVVKTKVRAAPYAAKLDELARARSFRTIRRVLDEGKWRDTASLRKALDDRHSADFADLTRMVALQEELDWLCYSLYGLDETSDAIAPEAVEPCLPTWLPWNTRFAEKDVANRAAIARGIEPDEQPSEWFNRHRWEPLATVPSDASPAFKKRVEARRERIRATPSLALIETANFKRRWYKPDYATEEQEALEAWLSDRIEDWAKERREPFTVEEAASATQADPAVLAVAEVITGRPDFNLVDLVAERVHEGAVPNQKHHVFKPSGLTKRAAWERTWAMQRAEDEAAKRGETAPAPPVPPKYAKADYLRDTSWTLRGALDVPKERFIALTEVPGREGDDLLFAWAGLTHRERARMLVELDELSDKAGVDRSDRIGILHGVWFLADYVAWESEQAARQYRAAVTSVVGQAGITEELLSEWAARHPAPRLRRPRPNRRNANTVREVEQS